MATYRVQRLFSKKSNKSKVAGHAVGAAVQGAVSGALLRDALKTKSNLAGAGAVLAGTGAAIHAASAIKAVGKKSKGFSESQKEFASVRLMKKQAKKLFDAAIQGDRKSAGKINAIVMKNGGGKNITVNSVGRGAQKISNGIAKKAAKTSGVSATPEFKKEIYQKGVENNLALARMMKASGGKLPKWQ